MLTFKIFTPFSNVSIVDFEQVNTSWVWTFETSMINFFLRKQLTALIVNYFHKKSSIKNVRHKDVCPKCVFEQDIVSSKEEIWHGCLNCLFNPSN